MSQSNAFLYDFDNYFKGGRTWQAALLQQIQELSAEQALWKPTPERHCIWDIVVHVNFWKEYMIAAARGEHIADYEARNWSLAPTEANDTSWKMEVGRATRLHGELRSIVEAMSDSLFDISNHNANLTRQIILHDAYHAGQIGLLRVMQGLKPVE